MEKFLVDLDSVLDELEAKEETTCIINESNRSSAANCQFGGLIENLKERDEGDEQSKTSQIKLDSFSQVNNQVKSLVSCPVEVSLVGQGSVNNQGQATQVDNLIKANLVDFKKEIKQADQEDYENEKLEAEMVEGKEEKLDDNDDKEEEVKVKVQEDDDNGEDDGGGDDHVDDDDEEVEKEEEKEVEVEEEKGERHEAVADQHLVNDEVNFIYFDSVLPEQDVFKQRDVSGSEVNDDNDNDDQILNQNKEMKSNLLIDDKFKDKSLNSKPLSFDNCQVDDIDEEEMNQYLSDIQSCPNQNFINPNIETNESSDLLLATHCSSSASNLTESEALLTADFSASSSLPVVADSVQDCQLEEKSLGNQLFRPSNLPLPSSLTSSASSSFSSTPSEMTNSLTSPFSSQPLLSHSNSGNVDLESNLLQEPSEVDEADVESPRPTVGTNQPFWIPDNEADYCMLCENKFTVIKRRHHCRICGKVLCSQCCRSRAKIPYMSYKEARVCYICFALLTKESAQLATNSIHSLTSRNENSSDTSLLDSTSTSNFENSIGTGGGENMAAAGSRNEPSSSNLSTAKPVSVLKKGPKPKGSEPKQVIFFDGIRPGGDLTNDQLGNCYFKQRSPKKIKSPTIEKLHSSSGSSKTNLKYNRIIIEDKKGPLPPIINNPKLEADPTFENLFSILIDDSLPPVTFLLTKNLLILIKCVKLDCCLGTECWTFTSQGLAPVGQDEIVIVLERLPEDNFIPRELFRMFTNVYDSSTRGLPFSDFSHILYPDGLFGSKENCGLMFMRFTSQCLKKITLPSPPYLLGILLHKCEIPWAKIFPLRLITKLGADFKTYPCPIVSYRQRKPCYFEVGHTIMNILADFRNFQYSLPIIPGLTIVLEGKKTTVNLPRNRYDKVMKALSSSNEYVLPFGGNLCPYANSHITCIQNDDGQYHTHTICDSSDSSPRITGASFIVFSGAFKTTSGLMAKISNVEDGLLVQMSSNLLNKLKSALKDMSDFKFECATKDNPSPEEKIEVVWAKDDTNFNVGVKSCVDGSSLEGVCSIRMYNPTDFEGDKYMIRWTETFLVQMSENARSKGDGADSVRIAEIIAKSLCLALAPKLELLVNVNIVKIGLRVTLDLDKFGYDVGSNGSPLPAQYINTLDAALIPTIMEKVAPNIEDTIVMELIFHILVK